MDNIFCPYCHKKNETTVTHCQYCGQLLIPETHIGTRSKDNSATAVAFGPNPDCEQALNVIAGDSLALFVMGSKKHFVIPQPQTIILGRGPDDTAQTVCDFSSAGLLASGISRRHAVIRKTAVGYSLQDLNSTNGTWLNNKRLEPDKAVTLNCQDMIVLAELKLTVCFHTATTSERTEMRLQKRNRLAQETRKLYPNFMSIFLVPYLEAIAELQRLIGLARTQPLKEPRIHKIAEDHSSIVVSLDLDAKAQRIITHTLLPWRELHTEYIGWANATNDSAMSEELNLLTSQILTAVAPHEALTSPALQKLQTAVATIITSPLEPAFSKETV